MARTKLGNLMGPQGVQGPKGATGAQGPQGATGPTGPKGSTGTRGSQWYTGTKVTGTSTAGTVFSGTGIASALVGDIYLNTSTGNVYHCTTAGAAAAAKWAYAGCIRGPQGAQGPTGATGATGPTGPQGKVGATGPAGPQGPKGEPTTVDTALSATSANPVQNKVVAAEFQDVRDSLGQWKFGIITVSIEKRSSKEIEIGGLHGVAVVVANAMSADPAIRAQGKTYGDRAFIVVHNEKDSEWNGAACFVAR